MGNTVSTEQLSGVLDAAARLWLAADARAIGAGIAVLVGGGLLASTLRRRRESRVVERRRALKQATRTRNLQAIKDKLDKLQNLNQLKERIGSLSLAEVLEKLKKREIKPSEVLAVYQAKALEAHESLNCLVEPILEADSLAGRADINPKAPFYGLPVSIKDNFGICGYDCTLGCINLAFKPYDEDSVLVKVLKDQGAIPFVKTNVPQTMMSWDCCNPLYGQTRNPHDPARGPGGSSGGEAALLGAGGSLLGLGGDIAGSIRIPCNMCGVCGLKPTLNRLSSKGVMPVAKGQAIVRGSYGPMARDVHSLVVFMEGMLVPGLFEEDPSVPPVPFNRQIYDDRRSLRIGYYTYDGYTRALPAMERGVQEARAALERAGHTLIQWQPPGVADGRMMDLSSRILLGDGGRHLAEVVGNDKIDACLKLILIKSRFPKLSARVVAPLLRLLGERKLARVLTEGVGLGSVTEWWELTESAESYRAEVIRDWADHGLDAVICPGFLTPAMPTGSPNEAVGAVSSTVLYNIINFPAGSVPVTTVTAEDEANVANYEARELWERTMKKGNAGSRGLPVNVQCIALPWNDELCLRVMGDIEREIRLYHSNR